MSGGPRRFCVGCRERRPQGELVRVVVDAAGVPAADPGRAAAGRGLYVCPALPCVEQAAKRGGLQRSLKRPVQGQEPRALARLIAAALLAEAKDLARRGARGAGPWIDLGEALGRVRGERLAWRAAIQARRAWSLEEEAARPRAEKAGGSKKQTRAAPPPAGGGAGDES